MELFSSKKSKSNKPVWKDANGNLFCPGDDCPQECDETCPIFLNTEAAAMSRLGQQDKALEIYDKILKIEPAFYDAWNNSGAINGQKGNFQKAHDCYLRAHELRPDKYQPLFGLALTSRDLKQYEECIKWCDEYDKLCPDGRCNQARATANAALNEGSSKEDEPVEIPSPMDICMKLLPSGKKDGFVLVDDAFPHIPEIMFQARTIVSRLIAGLVKESAEDLVNITLAWSAYAGMGAVRLWNDDWEGTKIKGIYESLTEPRGIGEMDEFVTDIIGWKYRSQKSKDFVAHLHAMTVEAILHSNMINCTDKDEQHQCIVNAAMAMYYYGMIIEMNELGMR